MAEKEERIFITKIQPECKFRELHETTAGGHTWVDFMCGKSKIKNLECDEKCFEQCEWKELTGISRQEAINRVARALHRESVRISNMEKDFDKLPAGWRESFYNYAESALNALLEGK